MPWPSPVSRDRDNRRNRQSRGNKFVEGLRRLQYNITLFLGFSVVLLYIVLTVNSICRLPASPASDHQPGFLAPPFRSQNSNVDSLDRETLLSTRVPSKRDAAGWEIVSASSTEEVPPFAIFYNVYMPHDQGHEAIQKALGIVQEQMDFVGNSYAGSYGGGMPVTVYYNTIGKRGALNSTYMDHVCSKRNNIICTHMEHHDKAFEEVTLQRMYEHCQYLDSPGKDAQDTKVVYMHNKGSYHDRSGANTRWRRHMMMAVTSEACLNPRDDVCDVCGLIFYDVWALMFPGNFYAAKCSYISKLIPPNQFNASMTRMFDLRRERIAHNPYFDLIFPNISNIHLYGTGRYASEQWPGSHPSMIPCDLTGTLVLDEWRLKDRTPKDLSWNILPRPRQTVGQYKMLLGNLFKWLTLYQEAPPDDSYAWKVFPDGEMWRKAVKLYGNSTVDVVMEIQRAKIMAASSAKE